MITYVLFVKSIAHRGKPFQSYEASSATWDYTFLPATRNTGECASRHNPR